MMAGVRRNRNEMRTIQQLTALHGCKLRSPFASVLAKLGPPDKKDLSPFEPDGSRWASYVWKRATPAIAVLTWLVESGEYVWGVRIFGPGPIDLDLGFGVGSRRSSVTARCPKAAASGPDSVFQILLDGSLTVHFEGDVVREVQLLAPMNYDPIEDT